MPLEEHCSDPYPLAFFRYTSQVICYVSQEAGPTEAYFSSLRSMEQRHWEKLQQQNAHWQQMIEGIYKGRTYQVVCAVFDC